MRAKIIFPNLLVVLILGLLSFFYLNSALKTRLVDRLTQHLSMTRTLFERSEDLRGFELLFSVRAQTMSKDVMDAFKPVDIAPAPDESQENVDKKIRQIWFNRVVKAVEVYSELWAQKAGRRPELVLITDRNGVAIARNITPNACPAGYNLAKSMPAVAKALDGEATYGIWSVADLSLGAKQTSAESCQLLGSGLLEVAAAPIWVGDAVGGALVIGFEVSNGTAKKKADMLGLEVAVAKNGDIYSSSLSGDAARQSLEKQIDLPEIAARVKEALDSGKPSEVFDIEVEGEPYKALVTPMRSAEPKDRLATIIMGSVDKATEDLNPLVTVLVFLGVCVLLVIVIGFMLAGHFLKPIMAIEEGLLKVINGEYNYRFDVQSSEVGGLSYRINQLIGVLTGEKDEQEE